MFLLRGDLGQAWLMLFADPERAPPQVASRQGGGLPPMAGYELANAAGRVTGPAELAWEAQRGAVFLAGAVPSRGVFACSGWQT